MADDNLAYACGPSPPSERQMGAGPAPGRRLFHWPRDVWLLLAGLAVAVLVSAGLRTLKLSRLQGLLRILRGRPGRTCNTHTDEIIARCRRAASVAGRVAPGADTCLVRALTVQTLLARRGIATVVHIGVRREGAALTAHAWVERDGGVILGGAQAPSSFEHLIAFEA